MDVLSVLAQAVTLLAIPFMTPSASGPHPGPPVFMQVKVVEQRIEVQLAGEQGTVLPWFELAGPLDSPLGKADEERLVIASQAILGELYSMAIDGELQVGQVVRVQSFPEFGPGNPEPSLQIDIVYSLISEPRTVGVVWHDFELLGEDSKAKLPLMLDAEDEFDFRVLIPEEPESIWHAGSAPKITAPEFFEEQPVLESATLPLLSLVLLALTTATLFFTRPRAGSRRCPRFVPLVLLGGAALSWNVARVPSPFIAKISVPAAEEAAALFERLHRNIYSAFDSHSEDQIYDVLARSVDLEILDSIYGDVYESLILREEGGAISEVESVEVLEREVFLGEGDEPEFDVDWCWTVKGVVTHWGHQHRRINRYRARYNVGLVNGAWRIRSVDVREQERIQLEDGEDV